MPDFFRSASPVMQAKILFFLRIQFRKEALPSCRKRRAPSPDAMTGVQLADASDSKGVYARAVKDKSSGTITGYKYEPRFTPPREEVEDGTSRRFNRLALGEYRTPDEAKILLQIARFYYGKDQDCVQLDGGQFKFFIPPANEQERGLAGEKKRKWVTNKAKQVYADLGIQKRNFEQLKGGACFSHDIRVSEIPSVSSANAIEVPSWHAPLPPCNLFAEPRDPVLQQLVHRLKQQLEVYSIHIVGLEHQLRESQILSSHLQHENERLQQENEGLRHENERLRTRLQRFANSQRTVSLI